MKHTFEGKVKQLHNRPELGLWVDGIMLSYDQATPTQFKLIEGKTYRVTVEEIEGEKEDLLN